MAIKLLDTNVIIRYIARDNPDHARRADTLFEKAQGSDLSITMSEGVLVEAVQVLSSKRLYSRPRDEIRDYLTSILNLHGMQLPFKNAYLRALELYASTNLDFVDALNVAHMERQGIGTIVSFDQGFDRVPGISREEP